MPLRPIERTGATHAYNHNVLFSLLEYLRPHNLNLGLKLSVFEQFDRLLLFLYFKNTQFSVSLQKESVLQFLFYFY